jgi:hypothetical protein
MNILKTVMKIQMHVVLFFIPFLSTSITLSSCEQPIPSLLDNVKSAATSAYHVAAPAASATSAFVCKSVIPFLRDKLSGHQTPAKLYIAYDQQEKSGYVSDKSGSDSNSDTQSDDAFNFVDSCDTFEMVDGRTARHALHKKPKKKQSFFATVQELDAQIEQNAGATLHKIHETIGNYYQQQDPTTSVVQREILHLTTLLQKSAKKIDLQPVIADQYNPIQLQILKDQISLALKKSLVADEEHETSIRKATLDLNRRVEKAQRQFDLEKKNAAEKYRKQITKLQTSTYIAAQISVAMNDYAQTTKTDHPAHELSHFATQESYTNFLKSLQENGLSSAIVAIPAQSKKKK